MEEHIQGSIEWLKDRLGHVSASNVKACSAYLKDGKTEGATRRDYRIQLVTERLKGEPTPQGYVSADMQRGIDLEPVARATYEAITGNLVDQCGFVKHPTIPFFGASPDGLIGEDGLLEIKCPKSATHIGYILDKQAPAEYKAQMNAQILCTGRKWVDFMSFDDSMPEHLQVFIVRYIPEQKALDKMLESVTVFLQETEEMYQQLRKEEK